MPIVPEYQTSVGVNGAQAPDVRIEPITPAASGAVVSEAAAGIGKTVETAATQLGRSIAYVQRLEASQTIADRLSEAQQMGQNIHSDLTSRKGASAAGITSGIQQPTAPPPGGSKLDIDYKQPAPQVDPESWDGQWAKIEAQAKEGLNTYELARMDRHLNSIGNAFRNSIIQHEVKEKAIARNESDDAAHAALVNTGAIAAQPSDLVSMMDQGKDIAMNIAARNGHNMADKDSASVVTLASNDQFAKAYVQANLERDPQKTQKMIDSISDRISSVTRGELQKNIDGKMLDIRENAIWAQSSGFKHADGTIDIASALQHAQSLAKTLPPGERQHVEDYVRKQASIADSALKDQREAESRQFVSDALNLKAKGLPYQMAVDQLFKSQNNKPPKYGFDGKDIRDKTEQLEKLYTSKDDFLDYAQQHQSPEQKAAWNWVDHVAISTVPKREVAAFKSEMLNKYIGKSADEIRAGVAEDLKARIPGPHFWSRDIPGWKVDADLTQANAEKMGVLESKYSSAQVSIAKAALESKGKMSDPDSIAKYLFIAHKK